VWRKVEVVGVGDVASLFPAGPVVVFIHKTALSDVTVPPPFFDFRNR
jgi:hypothetical protein